MSREVPNNRDYQERRENLERLKQKFLERLKKDRPLYGITEEAKKYLLQDAEFQKVLFENLKSRIIACKIIPSCDLDITSKDTLNRLRDDEHLHTVVNSILRDLLSKHRPIPEIFLHITDPEITKEIKSDIGIQDSISNYLGVRLFAYEPGISNEIEGYVHFASQEVMDKVLTNNKCKKNFIRCLAEFIDKKKDIPATFTSFIEEDIIQYVLARVLRDMLASNPGAITDIPKSYFELMSGQTLQNILGSGLRSCVYNNLEIEQDYFDLATKNTILEALEVGILVLLRNKKGIEIPRRHFDLMREISPKTLEKYLKSNDFQHSLYTSIVHSVTSSGHIPRQYIKLAEKRTLKRALRDGIMSLMEDGQVISKSHLDLCNKYLDFESILQEYIERCIYAGCKINTKYLDMTTPEMIAGFQSPEKVKEMAYHAIQHFFGESQITARATWEVVEDLNNEERHRLLFDKNLLPVGIKIHAGPNTKLAKLMQKTGGFVAHDQETCYVSSPVPNTALLKACMEVLDKIGAPVLSEHKNKQEQEKQMYIQVTSPDRLDNTLCGLATFAFLFSHSQILDFDKHSLSTNFAHGQKITIYDAGEVSNDFFIPIHPTHPGYNPEFNGRTDILMAFSMSDIENVNLIMTLLVSSQAKYMNMLLHKDIGIAFRDELWQLLKEHRLSEYLLDADFVDDGNTRAINLQLVLKRVTEIRRDDAQVIKKLEEVFDKLKGYDTYDITDPRYYDNPEKNELLERYRDLQERQSKLLSVRMLQLLQKYRAKVYENGYLNEFNISVYNS